jgi:hypothetical protein
MIAKSRRWRCDACKVIYRVDAMPLCRECGKAMTEIDKDGHPIKVVVATPQDDIIKVHLPPEWNERARKLVLSVFEGE